MDKSVDNFMTDTGYPSIMMYNVYVPKRLQFAQNEIYHIYNRGVDKRIIFSDEHDLNRFCLLLKLCNGSKYIDVSNQFRSERSFTDVFNINTGYPLVSIHSWSLMPNHFHILLSEIEEGGVSLFMKSISGAYSKYFNERNKRSGTLFEGRYRAKHANSDRYAKYLFSYLGLNRVDLLPSEFHWKENGIKNIADVELFLKNDQYSALVDYISPSNRLFSSIIDKKLYTTNYFSNEKAALGEIFEWLTYKDMEDDITSTY